MNLNLIDTSVLEPETAIDNYKILSYERKRQRGVVSCYVRNDVSYNILFIVPPEIENIFFEILPLNAKPIIASTIYRPHPNQSNV